jgi:cell division septum initiation protein DivIVA
MADKDLQSEIEELKAQLASLSRASGKDAAPSAESAATGLTGEAEGPGAAAWLKDIMKQAEEVMGGLDLQLKDVPAKTALLIFALGVLTGRMLSRRG